MKENDDELLRKRFSEEEAPVSPRVWANIKKTLPEDKGRKPWFRDIRIMSILAGLLVIGSVASGYFIFTKNKFSLDTLKNDKQIRVVENQNDKQISQNGVNDSLTNSVSSIVEPALDAGQNVLDTSTNINDFSESVSQNNLNEQKKVNSKTSKQWNNTTNKSFGDKKDDVTQPSFGNGNGVSVKNDIAYSNNENGKNNKKTELTNTKSKNPTGIDNKSDKAIHENISDNDNSNGSKSDVNINSRNDNFNTKGTLENLNADLTATNASNAKMNDVSIKLTEGQNKSIKIEEVKNATSIKSEINNPKGEQENNLVDIENNNSDSQKLIDAQEKKDVEAKDNIDNNGSILNSSSISENIASKVINKSNDTISSNTDNSITILASPVNVSDTVIEKVIDSVSASNKDSVVAITDTIKKDKKSKTGSRFSIDLVLAPMLAGAASSSSDNTMKSLVENKNSQDRNQFGYSFGGMVNYSVAPRLLLSSGLIYSSSSEKYSFKNNVPYDTTYTNSYIQTDSVLVQDTSGNYYIYSDSTITTLVTDTLSKFYERSNRDSYTFLSIPLTFSYYLIQNKRINILLTGGVKANLLLSGSTYVMNSAGTDLETVSAGFKKITFSYLASIGLEYKLTEKMCLMVQPIANYHMSSVHLKSYPLTQKPYSFGLNVGLRFKF